MIRDVVPLARAIGLAGFSLVALALAAHPALAQPTIEYAYDERGRLAVVADQGGNVAAYLYDAVGNILAIRRVDAAELPGAVGISVVSPQRGKPGTSVSIFGKGFGATPAQNTVTFNGTSATVVAAAAHRLTVLVPAGATTGPIRLAAPLGAATSPSPFHVFGTISITPSSTALPAGASQQFSASDDAGAPASVLWAVNDLVGGAPATGSIGADGVFTAPGAAFPRREGVTVTAIGRDDTTLTASAAVTILPPGPVFPLARLLSVRIAAPAETVEQTANAALSVAVVDAARLAMANPVSVAPPGASAFAIASALSITVGAGAQSQ
jgi:YD repeat-containing protein